MTEEAMTQDTRANDPDIGDASVAPSRVPLVDYLSLDEEPHLTAHECTVCRARFFDRRNACAQCSGTSFVKVAVATDGVVRTYSIVMFAAPGVAVPYIPAVIDCAGTSVRANLRSIEPNDPRLHVGLEVRLTTFPIGEDENGSIGIGFGFEPIGVSHDGNI